MAWNETVMLHKTTGLEGYYMLLSDTNFEKKISSNYEWNEIQRHHENGGGIGELIDTVELELAGGKRIEAPETVNLAACDCLDELGYKLWDAIGEYMVLFGIRREDDYPDWKTVKAVQETIIQEFVKAGVCFKFHTVYTNEKTEKDAGKSE